MNPFSVKVQDIEEPQPEDASETATEKTVEDIETNVIGGGRGLFATERFEEHSVAFLDEQVRWIL